MDADGPGHRDGVPGEPGRPTEAQARIWLERWERQQEWYLPDRDLRFETLVDVVVEVVDRPDPLVVDLGTGPGSLAHRLLERIPDARVVGVDADPLLLGLGAAARPDRRIRRVVADLRVDGWFDALELDRAPDAYVSSTALHWMNREPLRRLLATCRETLADGGVFVNADQLHEGKGGERIDAVAERLTALRADRVDSRRGEDWQAWWQAVEAAPELADLVAERNGGFEHVVHDRPSVHDHLALLHEAGFSEAGQVWQVGDERIVVGLA